MPRAVLALLLALVASACSVTTPHCVPAAVCPLLQPPHTLDDSPAWRAIAPHLDAPSADDLFEIELQVAHAIDPTLDLDATRSRVAAMVTAVRRTLPRRCDARCRVVALNRHLFETLGFTAVSDPDSTTSSARAARAWSWRYAAR